MSSAARGRLPGPVTSMMSAGCHEQIRAGMATSSRDGRRHRPRGRSRRRCLDEPRGVTLPTDDLSPEETRVHEGLPHRDWVDLAQVSLVSALAPMQAMAAALARLVELGLAERRDGTWRKARAPRR